MTQQNTQTGTLLDGVLFEGESQRNFELRLPLMRHTGEALEQTVEKFGTTDGFDADTFYRIAVLAGALVSLGNIPQESLTAELLYDNLSEDDFDVLKAAQASLKEKRNGGKPDSPDSASPSSPSENTASPNSES